MKQYEQVREFHRVFGHPVADEETNIPTERVAQRFAIMREEVREYEDAIKAGDLVEVADALADLAYTVFGTLVEHGVPTYDLQENGTTQRPHLLSMDEVQGNIRKLDELLQEYVQSATLGKLGHSEYLLFRALTEIETLFKKHCIAPGPIFEIVHFSNLSKLDENGDPVPHPTIPGKVGKSDRWRSPQAMIENELKVQGYV